MGIHDPRPAERIAPQPRGFPLLDPFTGNWYEIANRHQVPYTSEPVQVRRFPSDDGRVVVNLAGIFNEFSEYGKRGAAARH